ncbi:MAG: carbonic anhydrase family protein [Ideonella sp.]
MPARTETAKAATAPGAASVAAPADAKPLDQLRQRLADRLGAPGKSGGKKADAPVVRLVNKSEPEPLHASRPAATRAGGEARDQATASNARAARLAAAYRDSLPREQRLAAGPVAGAPIGDHPAKLVAGPAPAPHWDYRGEGGPESWGALQPDFATCANGTRQSPIDIRDGLRLELDPVQFDYAPSAIRVIDNGHTVQVNVAAGNSIEVMGRRFELVQFHFHRPSEERLDGRRFDMVVHLVHKDLEGKLAVVAVLLNRGAAQPLIQTVWNNLPLEKGMDQPVRLPVDLNALLPQRRDYVTYMGSLTTPPCTEGVLWMVMKTPVEVSPEQIGIFSRLYPMNARPLQDAGGRLIKESN